MVRVRSLGVALLALATVALVAVPAGATPAPTPKFCSAFGKITSGGKQPTPQQAKALAARFKAAANRAPAKVKAAGNTIVSVLSKLGDIRASSAAELGKFYTSSDFKKYGKSVGTFVAYGGTCTSS